MGLSYKPETIRHNLRVLKAANEAAGMSGYLELLDLKYHPSIRELGQITSILKRINSGRTVEAGNMAAGLQRSIATRLEKNIGEHVNLSDPAWEAIGKTVDKRGRKQGDPREHVNATEIYQ